MKACVLEMDRRGSAHMCPGFLQDFSLFQFRHQQLKATGSRPWSCEEGAHLCDACRTVSGQWVLGVSSAVFSEFPFSVLSCSDTFRK